MKIQNALVSNILNRSQRYFAHVTTVTLSWRVQNIVVIGHAYFTLECFEFSSNFEFDRNMLSGTGARSRNCGCLITWFCYQLIAKPGNKTVPVPWLDPYNHVDSSVKHLAADPTTRLWTCMCGVNNVNLTVINNKLCQYTWTLIDYRFPRPLTKWISSNKVTTIQSHAITNNCTPCGARYPSVVVFEGRATGRTNLRNIHPGWTVGQKSQALGINSRWPLLESAISSRRKYINPLWPINAI